MTPSSPDLTQEHYARWEQLQAFIAAWYPPLDAEDGLSLAELAAIERQRGLPLPAALREWYALAGLRPELTSGQNELLPAAAFGSWIRDGYVIIYDENQDVVRWGIRVADLALPDPPVFLNETSPQQGAVWTQEAEHLSSFIFQVVVFETIMKPEIRDWVGFTYVDLDPAAVERVRRECDQLRLPTWTWPLADTLLLGNQDVLVYHNVALCIVVANNQANFSRVEQLLGVKLEPPQGEEVE